LLSSGDLPCRTTESESGPGALVGTGPITLLNRRDLEADFSAAYPHLPTGDMLEQCWSELQRRPPSGKVSYAPPVSADYSDFKEGLLDYRSACVNLGVVGKVLKSRQDNETSAT